ncbi:MAG: MFS transporter [Anaerolineae bacterium]|nr:MFS transporter [Anaerolineae bacterium]
MATQFSESENPRWRNTFFPVWIGQAISLVGSRLVGFSLVWYLTTTTGSATILTTISLIGLLPEMLLAPFAGALVDRWNRKKVMVIADSAIALLTLVLAGLFLFDLVEIWHIYVLMFMRSIGGAFHYPAMSASTSLMVPREKLTKVQGMNQVLHSILTIVAAPMGALVLGWLDVGQVMMIDVVTAAIAIFIIAVAAIPQPAIITTQEQKSNPVKTMLLDVKQGLHYVVGWKGLLYVLIFATFLNAILNPAFSLLPLLVKGHFQLDVGALATMETAMGIGMLIGSVLLSAWGGFKKKMYTSLMGLFGLGMAALLMGLAPSNTFWMAVVGTFMFGLANPITNGPLFAIFQETIDPGMQGRVFSLINTTAMAASPIGLAIAGPLSDSLGVQSWFLVGGIFCVTMPILLFSNAKVRDLEKGNPNAEQFRQDVVADPT